MILNLFCVDCRYVDSIHLRVLVSSLDQPFLNIYLVYSASYTGFLVLIQFCIGFCVFIELSEMKIWVFLGSMCIHVVQNLDQFGYFFGLCVFLLQSSLL